MLGLRCLHVIVHIARVSRECGNSILRLENYHNKVEMNFIDNFADLILATMPCVAVEHSALERTGRWCPHEGLWRMDRDLQRLHSSLRAHFELTTATITTTLSITMMGLKAAGWFPLLLPISGDRGLGETRLGEREGVKSDQTLDTCISETQMGEVIFFIQICTRLNLSNV